MQSTKTFDALSVKNILVVRQHNQLGDMLCSTPLFAALKSKFRNASITLVASPFNCRMFEGGSEYVDNLIKFDKSKPASFFNLIRTVRKRKYEIGIVPSTVSASSTSHYINFLSGARIRIGAASINGRKNKSAGLLTDSVDFNWSGKEIHQTERNLDYGRLLGADYTEAERKKVRIKLNTGEIKFSKDFFRENFPDKDRKVFAFHAGAGKAKNRWSPDRFIKLIEMLRSKFECYIMLTSGYMDREVTDYLLPKLEKKKIKPVIIEKPHLKYIATVLAEADLYVTNDTGLMHVAAFVNAKVIGLFGPTKAYEWGPQNEFGRSIQSPSEDIDKITVEKVFEESEKLIALKRK